MGLPKVTFKIQSDGLGRIGDGVKKVAGIVLTGNTVAGKVELGKSYQVFSMKDVEELGIEKDNENAFAHKQLSDFYEKSGNGTELWLMLVSDATTQEQMTDVNEPYATKLIADAKGVIRILGAAKKAVDEAVIEHALDIDSGLSVVSAESLAQDCEEKYMPIRVVVGGNNFSGDVTALLNYRETHFPHVAMTISNNDGSKTADVGSALGRLANIPTQRSIARVKDGAIELFKGYFTDGSKAEDFINSRENIHAKGYLFYTTHASRPGYYFSDDLTLTVPTNDFSSLARGLVMDEAMIISYNTLVEELSSEVQINTSGEIHPAIIKNWQANVERQINALMVSQGKLSNVKCFINPKQDVLSSDKLEVSIMLQPVGYAKHIEVKIGFKTKLK